MAEEKVKYYELDYGDQPLVTESIDQLLEIIREHVKDMGESAELEYVITTRMMTQKEVDELPEWEG